MTIERKKEYLEINGLKDICFFSHDSFMEGQIVCLEIEDKLTLYQICSLPKEQYTFEKTYYAKRV